MSGAELFAAFVIGNLYATCAGVMVDAIHDRPQVRHRWHRLPSIARTVLTAAWPVTCIWLFGRDHG